MKKILFVIHNLEIGGIQRSLVELLNLIHSRYEITLYCINYSGTYINELPKGIKLIRGNRYAINPECSKSECRRMGLTDYFLHIITNGWSRLFGRKYPAKLICKLSGKIKGDFDVAISFAQPSNDKFCISLTNEIVLYNCTAKKKVSFLHSDFLLYGGNTQYTCGLYKSFDAIAAVSESVKNRLITTLPIVKYKTFVVRNACDVQAIDGLSRIDTVEYNNCAIVSVSRLGPEKGLIRCIPIVRKLKDEGFDFEWHIVGDGQVKEQLEKSIKTFGLENVVFMEGNQSNPYRFMRNAKALFLPSFHEAAPMVFHEAACLGVWVLTTNTLSAKELVKDNNIGDVCANDEDGIYKMLKNFLSNLPVRKSVFRAEELNELVINQFDNIIKS